MGVVDGDVDGSGRVVRATVRFKCLVRCKGRIGLWLHLGSSSDVSTTAILTYSVTVRHG